MAALVPPDRPFSNRARRFAILERRHQVIRLYCQGVYQSEIARLVGVDTATVCRDLQALHEEWKAEHAEALERRKAEQLAKIDHEETVAWEAWERSCQDAESEDTVTVSGRTTKDGAALPDLTRTTRSRKGQAGDPRFLERVSWCIEQRCKLLRLYPEKTIRHRHGGDPDAPPVSISLEAFKALPVEEKLRVLNERLLLPAPGPAAPPILDARPPGAQGNEGSTEGGGG